MKFVSGARVRHASFTIVPSRKVVLPDTTVAWSKPLRAEFRDHRFDSVRAQRDNEWTDEERELVENKLMSHRRFNQSGGRGIYIDKTASRRAPVSAVEADAEAAKQGLKMRCLHFSDQGDEGLVQCSETVDPEFPERDLCVKHRVEMEAANA